MSDRVDLGQLEEALDYLERLHIGTATEPKTAQATAMDTMRVVLSASTTLWCTEHERMTEKLMCPDPNYGKFNCNVITVALVPVETHE